MGVGIKMSRSAAQSIIGHGEEAIEELSSNSKVMEGNVKSAFEGLSDPSYQRCLELFDEASGLIKSLVANINNVNDYCRKVMIWIDDYSGT